MRLLASMLLGAALTLSAGCKTVTATSTPLAPGYQNAADQTMGVALVAAHAFYTSIAQDVAAGKYTPSATEKTALDAFAVALNSAQILYIAYHAGTATEAAAQTSVNNLTTQQTALESTITGSKQ